MPQPLAQTAGEGLIGLIIGGFFGYLTWLWSDDINHLSGSLAFGTFMVLLALTTLGFFVTLFKVYQCVSDYRALRESRRHWFTKN